MAKKRKSRKGKTKKRKNPVARDLNILAAYRREIDLREKRIPKKRYTRKKKHKGGSDDI